MRRTTAAVVVLTAAVIAAAAAHGQDADAPTTRVVDAAGTPVEGAHVWFLRGHDTNISGDAEHGPIVQVRGRTDARGALPPRVRDGGSLDAPLITSSCFLAFSGERAAFRCWDDTGGDVVLGPAAHVRLRVLEDGEPLPESTAVRLHFPGGNCSHGIDPVGHEEGVLEFPPLPAWSAAEGRLRLTVAAQGVWAGPYDVPGPDANGVATIDLLPTRRVTGRVVTVEGAPIEKAVVWPLNPTAPYRNDGHVTTGEDGRFSLEGVMGGATRIFAKAPGFATTQLQVSGGQESQDVGDVVVRRGRPITGRVVEEDGADVVAYAVFVETPDGARIARGEAQGRGRFETEPVSEERVTLRVFVHWSAGIAGTRHVSREIDVDGTDVEIVVPKGLAVRLVDADGAAVSVDAAELQFALDGRDAGSERFGNGQYGRFSEVRMLLLPETAGSELEVSVTTDDGRTGRSTVIVDDGGEGDIDVRLSAPR